MKKLTFRACTLGATVVAALIFAPLSFAAGAHDESSAGKTEIIISAAASLTDAVGECITLYARKVPSVKVTPTYGSSGSLQMQIEQGAPVDLFISAAPKQMNALEGKSLIDKATRRDLFVNSVVLVAPAGKKAGFTSFKDLSLPSITRIALGEPASVPVGQYSAQIFSFLGIASAVDAKAVYAKDVRQVLAWVESGEVDAGVVYATDAAISKGVTVIAKAPEGSHAPVIYPAAVVSGSAHPAEAKAFLEWLSGPEASAVFTKYGFSIK